MASEAGGSWADEALERALQAPREIESTEIVDKLSHDPDVAAAAGRLDPALVARGLPELTEALERNGLTKMPEVARLLAALGARGAAGSTDTDPYLAALAAAAGQSVMLADLFGADPSARHVSDRLAAALERAAASPRAVVAEADGETWRLAAGAAGKASLAPDGTRFLAAPDLVAVLAEAARLARHVTRGQRRTDARHAVAALLGTVEGRQAFVDLGVAGDPPGRWLADLASAYAGHLRARAADTDDLNAWDEQFGALFPADLEAGLVVPGRVRLQLPGYDPDFVPARRRPDTPSVLASDRLGVAEDARALADLICLRRASPPIAIGVFGAWGSGKSTFMRMIEEAAEANRTRAAEMADEGVEPPFVRNVVHVWFNAWHYVDANLWASLVSHIFRELSRRGSRRDLYDEAQLVGLVRELDLAGQAESEAQLALNEVSNEIGAAKAALHAIEARKKALGLDLARKDAETLTEAARTQVRDAMAGLGVQAAVETFDQLTALAGEARSLGGHLRLLVSAAAAGDGYAWYRIAMGVVFLALVTGLFLAGATWGPVWTREALAAFAVTLGPIGGLAAWLLPHLRRVTASVGTLTKAEADAARQRQAIEAERRALEEQLASLEDRRQRQEAELDARRRERERLEALRRGDRPAELLARFIEDRAGVEGYRKHLGLLSRIRGDFELMSDLMARRAEPRGHAELPQIDRIVLYIDDLDRCRDEQVVEVLEAIHLLLAFDLFVVVVGVDSRWVEGALSRVYRCQLASRGLPADSVAAPERATVADYLEKIFQIPFRLRPLDLSDGGGYDALVTALVGEVTRAAPDENGERADTAEAAAASATLRTVAVAPPLRKESAAEILDRVTLTDRELDAIRALGPLLGRSPRTVKRFVNLYRLLRTRRRGPRLDAFLAEPVGEEGAPLYRLAILWLAFETGLNIAQKRRLRDVLLAADDDAPLRPGGFDIGEAENWGKDISSQYPAIAAFFESLEHGSLRDTVRQAWLDVQDATRAQIDDVSVDAARYCFDLKDELIA